MYCQRYGVNETINDSTAGSIGQEQHSISQRYREHIRMLSGVLRGESLAVDARPALSTSDSIV
jgi:hypothetical protein